MSRSSRGRTTPSLPGSARFKRPTTRSWTLFAIRQKPMRQRGSCVPRTVRWPMTSSRTQNSTGSCALGSATSPGCSGPAVSFFLWGGYSNIGNYPHALEASGLYFSQQIIWIKEHPVLTRKDFLGNHEWCFYGWRQGAAHQFLGPTNATDVWSVKKVSPQAMVHLTEKPVELAVRALQYGSRRGENVLDLFGG